MKELEDLNSADWEAEVVGFFVRRKSKLQFNSIKDSVPALITKGVKGDLNLITFEKMKVGDLMNTNLQ